MGKSSNTPPPPDPIKTSAAQTTSNVQTAVANSILGNANTYGPTGSTTYQKIGEETIIGPDGKPIRVPKYSQTTTLSPEQQKLYNQQTQLGSDLNNLSIGQVNRLKGVLDQPINFEGLPDRVNSVSDDFSADRKRVEDALFERLNPQLRQQDDALRTRLANQGITMGSEAWNTGIDESNRAANDARIGAVLNAGQEQSRLLADALQRAGFQNSNREAGIQERLTSRNQPINEITALMSGGQVSMPQFQGYRGGNVAGTDVAGNTWNAYNAQVQKAQADQAAKSAMWGNIAKLGGSLLAAPMTGGGSVFGGLLGMR